MRGSMKRNNPLIVLLVHPIPGSCHPEERLSAVKADTTKDLNGSVIPSNARKPSSIHPTHRRFS
jgi:hypothetical protein